MTLDERIEKKLAEFGLNQAELLEGLFPVVAQGEEKEKKPEPIIKSNAKHHYDKEDLISFHQLFITKPLVKACQELEFEHPTVIQRQVIPAVLEGNDILAHAVTGSGKTASYLLPMLEKYLRLR